MKKISLLAICVTVFYSCKKSGTSPDVPKTPDKNFIIEVTCTELCNVQVDTALSYKDYYPTFDKQDNIKTYKNSLDATGGKSRVSIHVYDPKEYSSPNPKTIKITYKGQPFFNQSYPATASFIVQGLVSN